MSNFIKVDGCNISQHRASGFNLDGGSGEAYIRISEIKELCELTGKNRLAVPATEIEYQNRESDDDYKVVIVHQQSTSYFRFIESTEITIAFVGEGKGDQTVHAGMVVNESIEDLKARIDAAENPAPPPHALNDRGEWKPGETYNQLDLVKNPDDVSKSLIALQSSTSIDKVILAKRSVWCHFELEE